MWFDKILEDHLIFTLIVLLIKHNMYDYEIIYIVKIKPFYLNNNVKFKLRLSKVLLLELLKFINL